MPNLTETVIPEETEPATNPYNVEQSNNTQKTGNDENSCLQIFHSVLNLLAHILIGCIVSVCLTFVFRMDLPLSATFSHIAMCVIGYQLLMAQAILSLSSRNDWSSRMSLVQKKRAHWILMLAGSALAITGSVIKMVDKQVHFNTYHGIFGFVALIFTAVSLVNGVTSLWSFELRRFIPANLSRITHIGFGTIAFVTASISLCYGFDKGFFRGWASDSVAYTFIGFTCIMTFIVIVNPFITFYRRCKAIGKG